MAVITMTNLQNAVLQRCNIFGSGFLTAGDAELLLIVNNSIEKAWRFLARVYGVRFAFATQDITTAASTAGYALETDPEFWELRRIALLCQDGKYRPIRPLMMGDEVFEEDDGDWQIDSPRYYLGLGNDAKNVYFNPTPLSARTVRIHYTTAPPVAGTDTEIDLLGHNDLVILDAAVTIDAEKRGLDASAKQARLLQLMRDIRSNVMPDDSGPIGVVDQRRLEEAPYYGFTRW